MILGEGNEKKPKIEYPCEWSYRVIGDDIKKMVEAVENAVEGMKYDLQASNISKKGNYFSINLKVVVENEVVRDIVFEKIKNHENVKMLF
jgi:putative lipoic acid-binding regulatory protein